MENLRKTDSIQLIFMDFHQKLCLRVQRFNCFPQKRTKRSWSNLNALKVIKSLVYTQQWAWTSSYIHHESAWKIWSSKCNTTRRQFSACSCVKFIQNFFDFCCCGKQAISFFKLKRRRDEEGCQKVVLHQRFVENIWNFRWFSILLPHFSTSFINSKYIKN